MGGDFFTLEVVTTGEAQVIVLRGELDVANADRVQHTLLAAESPLVVVDLSALTFIDSSGLTALVHAHDDLIGRGHRFELRGASNEVKRVFEITGLTELLAES